MAQIAVFHPDEPFPQEGLDGLRKAMEDSYPVVQIAAVMSMGGNWGACGGYAVGDSEDD